MRPLLADYSECQQSGKYLLLFFSGCRCHQEQSINCMGFPVKQLMQSITCPLGFALCATVQASVGLPVHTSFASSADVCH